MKSFGRLWTVICSIEDLARAARLASRGKRGRGPLTSGSPERVFREPVHRFLADLEHNLEALRNELVSGSYRPAPFSQFKVRDPKPRLISCAEFRDRVVHHAVCGAIGPLLDMGFIDDSYACRKGRGTHAAVRRARDFARRFAWYAKLDIRKYFDSIDHDRLLALIGAKFREKPLRVLLETIVRFPLPGQIPGKGLPIGSLTSQWFANFYLDGVDHRIKDGFRVPGYVRYMDDLLLFDRSREKLEEIVANATAWLKEERRLEVKIEKIRFGRCEDGLPFLGWRVFPNHLRLLHGRYHRCRRLLRKREREHVAGAITEEALTASARAICAGIKHLRPGFRIPHSG